MYDSEFKIISPQLELIGRIVAMNHPQLHNKVVFLVGFWTLTVHRVVARCILCDRSITCVSARKLNTTKADVQQWADNGSLQTWGSTYYVYHNHNQAFLAPVLIACHLYILSKWTVVKGGMNTILCICLLPPLLNLILVAKQQTTNT